VSPFTKTWPGKDRRAERRIEVGLPMLVRGTEPGGISFEESTRSHNVSRSGAAFRTTRRVDVGTDIEIIILRRPAGRESESDFITRARVVRVLPGKDEQERIVGVQFLGPRFHHIFVSEWTG